MSTVWHCSLCLSDCSLRGIVSLPAMPSELAGLWQAGHSLVGEPGNGLSLKAFSLLANKVTRSGMDTEQVQRLHSGLPAAVTS